MTSEPKMQRASTSSSTGSPAAVLLLNFQNEIAKPGGLLHDVHMAEVMTTTGILTKAPEVVRIARQTGALVIHCPIVINIEDKPEDERMSLVKGDSSRFVHFLNEAEDEVNNGIQPYSEYGIENLFAPDTWSSQIVDEVRPTKSDITLKTARSSHNAFHGTGLESILNRHGIKKLILMGFMTNSSIEETAKSAHSILKEDFLSEGKAVIVLSDGCAARTLDAHNHAINVSLDPYCDIKTCAEAQAILKGSIRTVNRLSTLQMAKQRSIQSMTVSRSRPCILALHGARSNNEVTSKQLENLKITDDEYDITYMHGSIKVEEADDSLAGLVQGPFYSWIDEKKISESTITAVHDVLLIALKYGPFDGIYGFSTGAVIATLAVSAMSDPILRSMIIKHSGNSNSKVSSLVRSNRGSISLPSSRRLLISRLSTGRKSIARVSNSSRTSIARISLASRLKLRQSTRSQTPKNFRSLTTLTNQNFDMEATSYSNDPGYESVVPSFKFIILGCSASPSTDLSEFCEKLGVSRNNMKSFASDSVKIPSFHLIGLEDKFKSQSEEFASLFAQRSVMYIPTDHAISREQRADTDLTEKLEGFLKAMGNPVPIVETPEFIPQSEVSSVGLVPQLQVALVDLDTSKLPEDMYPGGATIRSLLKARDPQKPLLHVSREPDPSKCTTYGDVLNFMDGGPGDLRRLGVKVGEVVAYGAPPGGGAVPAMAFLSIGAQTPAAPLAPGTTEPDALDALDQFNAKHLILFEGVKCPGVEEAFHQYAAAGKARIHRARIVGDNKPGFFEFVTADEPNQSLQGKALSNPEDGICLLLRTSGTTARPKGVPLSQKSLVTNGAIIAASMSLTEADVVYSVMPLFHIGGISASILCTMASGGAVSCDGDPFDPDRMIDALAISRPQPTWYSSVPTIHNATVSYMKDFASESEKHAAYGIDKNGIWKSGHSLRMIRSGAAALLGPDGDALSAAYGGIPIYPTYSMSEQMPISQPPAGKQDTLSDRPGSVGVPVAASTAIVSRSTLRPLPPGQEGEIAISGPTVLKNYLENPDADRKSYFHLTLPQMETGWHPNRNYTQGWYFLTGDVGTIDKDGFLSLKGRAKELIKKGGEQVSPFEVEEPLTDHPWIQTVLSFAVPSKLYGEEVGCAIVLSLDAPMKVELKDVIVEMRSVLKTAKLAPIKWPSKWILVQDSDLPKTKTKKYIRIGLSGVLGMNPEDEMENAKDTLKAQIDWGTISGFRFLLSCYVMFMHFGSGQSWGAFNNLRGFPWHVHVFFTLGGYSMALPMNPAIVAKFKFFKARISSMYPMYVVALIFALINLLVGCRPSTFRKDFHWDSQPDDRYTADGEMTAPFCEGTVVFPTSYWASLIFTIVIYLFGLAITPIWPLSWALGFYLWFNSMFYQCLTIFPSMYNAFYNRTKKRTKLLLTIMGSLMVLNYIVLLTVWFVSKSAEGYNHLNLETGESNPVEEYTDGSLHNALILSFYLFSPFWMLYFVIGTCLAFLYDACNPKASHNARRWGWVADGISLFMIAMSIVLVCQGREVYSNHEATWYFRPQEADNPYADNTSTNRLWSNIYARFFCPVTTLWVFALTTGEGFTASVLRSKFLVETLSPNAYNCFLFHQMVAQWYFAATRNGVWWNWWNFRKSFYWFSPNPVPVEWYEYPFLVGLTVSFSSMMNILLPSIVDIASSWVRTILGQNGDDEDIDTEKLMIGIIEKMTGIEPKVDWSLEECGLASVGVPVIVGMINKALFARNKKVSLSAAELVEAETISDMVNVVDDAIALADADGV